MLSTDVEIAKFMQENLHVAAVCDILDSLGYRRHGFHHGTADDALLPDLEGSAVLWAAPGPSVGWMPTTLREDDPYGLEIEAMDSLKPGDVVVHSTDYAGTNAPWGDLMSTVAQRNGAVGCVCDSQIRDCIRIIELGFPVYYSGIRPLDSMGRGMVMAYDVPIRCGDVLVKPGNLIFADFDGIVVVPNEVEEAVLEQAQEKVHKENLSRKELQEGKSLRAVYMKYGVL